MFDVFICTDIKMSFTGKEKALCFVGVCSVIVGQDCAACICEGVFKTVAYSNADLDMAQTIERGRLFVHWKRILTKKISK